MLKKLYTPLFLLFFSSSFAQFAPGKSLNFNGTSGYVLTTFAGITGKGSRTIEAWVKSGPYNSANGGGNDQRIICDYGTATGTGGRYTTAIQWSQRNFRTEIGGNGNQGAASFLDGYWHHVAVVYDSSASGSKTTTYVDGIQDWNGDYTVTLNTGTANTFRIGVRVDGVNFFLGEIDEVRFWKGVRTAAEIADNMFKRVSPAEANLVAYYDFDAATTGSAGVPDLVTANPAHAGTMTGMVASDIVTSAAPIHFLNSITNTRGIWSPSSTSTSSGGLTINSTASLANGNTAVYGQINNNTSTTNTDLPVTLSERFNRIWAVDINGTVTSNIYFNVPVIYGSSVSLASASNYHLLYRNSTSGTFTDLGVATTIISGTTVQFSNIALQDGFYTLGFDYLLPMKLIDFTLTKQDKNVLIKWQTSFENNVNKYIVERKNNSANWSVITSVLPKNTQQSTTYQFKDENPFPGGNHYRLTAIDNDGKTTVSKIVSLIFSNNSGFTLYPNPTKNFIVIEHSETDTKFTIKNILGKVMNCNVISESGLRTTIDIANLASGIYFIHKSTGYTSFIKE